MGLFGKIRSSKDDDSEKSAKDQAKEMRKNCFVCSKKFGLLATKIDTKYIEYTNQQFQNEGFSSSVLEIPQGMTIEHRICSECFDQLYYKKSTEIISTYIKLKNPYDFAEMSKKSELMPKLFVKFTQENPSFFDGYNYKIDECFDQLSAIDDTIKEFQKDIKSNNNQINFNRGWNLVRNQGAFLNGTSVTNAYQQNNSYLKMSIKELEMKKQEIISILKNLPWHLPQQTIEKTPLNPDSQNSDPLNVLKLRLAKGEITKAEFDELKHALNQ